MPNPTAISPETHSKTRVIADRGARFGENIHFCPVLADELQNLVRDYPVCLMKDPGTGQFGLFALLGFEPGENLFLEEDRWNATYVPIHIRRQPFMVAFTSKEGEPRKAENAVITLDMDSNRVQEEQGELLFGTDGSQTEFLQNMVRLLSGLMTGLEATEIFVKFLVDQDLLEPAQLNITFAGGEKKRFEGLYTVNGEKLRELSGEALQNMHNNGYLQACTLIGVSMGQVQRLIELRNARTRNRS